MSGWLMTADQAVCGGGGDDDGDVDDTATMRATCVEFNKLSMFDALEGCTEYKTQYYADAKGDIDRLMDLEVACPYGQALSSW